MNDTSNVDGMRFYYTSGGGGALARVAELENELRAVRAALGETGARLARAVELLADGVEVARIGSELATADQLGEWWGVQGFQDVAADFLAGGWATAPAEAEADTLDATERVILMRRDNQRAAGARRVAAYCRELRAVLPVLQLGPGVSALCATLAPHHMIHGIRRAGFELEKETDSSWIYRNTEAPNRGHLAWVPKHREYLDYGSAIAKVVRDVAEARGWSQAETLLYFLRIADLYEAAEAKKGRAE